MQKKLLISRIPDWTSYPLVIFGTKKHVGEILFRPTVGTKRWAIWICLDKWVQGAPDRRRTVNFFAITKQLGTEAKVGGWTHPSEKYAYVKLDHFPRTNKGEKNK